MSGFTHFNEDGNAVMVDVGEKAETKREALASGVIRMSEECFQKVKEGSMKKGDVLGVARIAGIMGAKKTAELILNIWKKSMGSGQSAIRHVLAGPVWKWKH